MSLRASKALVFSPFEGDVLVCNFLTKDVVQTSPALVEILTAWHDWHALTDLERLFAADLAAAARHLAPDLLEKHILVERGSSIAAHEDDFEQHWRWGLPAAMMHFCVQDEEYLSLAESAVIQIDRASSTPSPDLFLRNPKNAPIIKLPEIPSTDPLLGVMAKRRTVRTAAPTNISIQDISDCLFAGMGVTGWTMGTTGSLPLTMTPSGGARNPYEAYVLARNVDGLEPGLYHYSALDHDLGQMESPESQRFSDLLGGQEWTDEMAALVILSANFERSMWKYSDANAYRVVLIEAGHIGQNIMLAATRNGLSACPTAALNHTAVKRLLGLNGLTAAPIYALTLAVPGDGDQPR